MNKIGLFDTSLESDNLGDEIIMESVNKELQLLIRDVEFNHVPTHRLLNEEELHRIRSCPVKFVGGTNLLANQFTEHNQWRVTGKIVREAKPVHLFGAGWWQYQEGVDRKTKRVLRKFFGKRNPHSVRDEYTKEKLVECGFTNVYNTGCPTIWNLPPTVPRNGCLSASDVALFTLTDYNKNPTLDRQIIEILCKNYKSVEFWPQGQGDLGYLMEVCPEHLKASIVCLERSLAAIETALAKGRKIDYLGTRLHAGIKALQNGKKALIFGVDNRALEMSKDIGLPVVGRSDFGAVMEWIMNRVSVNLRVPHSEIAQWKEWLVRSVSRAF